MIPSFLRRLRDDERGFTMVTVVMTMFLVGLFSLGAYEAAKGDILPARQDQDRKRAYEAAEAGLAWYAFQLERDPAYWTKCTAVPAPAAGVPAPVNSPWDGVGSDPRVWRTLIASDERYTIELLPAKGSGCSTTDPAGSMLSDGVLTVRATGAARGEKRSLIASFRRRGFVDFVYFTQWETQDPVSYGSGDPLTQAQAATLCNASRATRDSRCKLIQFMTQDAIRGPLHTNDSSIYVNGNPTFGRGKGDVVEVAGPSPGWVGSGSPIFAGTRVTPAPTLSLPPSNGLLAATAAPGYRFTGNTCVVFDGTTEVTVKTGMKFKDMGGQIDCTKPGASTVKLTFPDPNGNSIIYVDSDGTCTDSYDRDQRYDNGYGCGDVAVQGQYATSVTVAARNDVIIRNSVTRKVEGAMLGLIGNNFVRVYHPVGWSSGTCTSAEAGGPSSVQIDAAILALSHSFITDNWACGAKLGSLTVRGAIAQYYRGPVGTGNGTTNTTGFIKDYQYDDRLRYQEPPNFLDPVQTKWNLIRRGEQQPAR